MPHAHSAEVQWCFHSFHGCQRKADAPAALKLKLLQDPMHNQTYRTITPAVSSSVKQTIPPVLAGLSEAV